MREAKTECVFRMCISNVSTSAETSAETQQEDLAWNDDDFSTGLCFPDSYAHHAV